MRNFIFDVDRTLVDSYSIEKESLKKALFKVTKKSYGENIMDKLSILSTKEFFRLINIDINSDTMKDINLYWDKYLNESTINLFLGIEKELKNLKNNKCFLGIVTSRTYDELCELSEFTKIKNLFDVIITSDIVSNPKPDPESLLKIINDFSLEKNETVYIGDSDLDSIASKRANIKFAYASYENKNSTEEYDYILNNVSDISSLLDK